MYSWKAWMTTSKVLEVSSGILTSIEKVYALKQKSKDALLWLKRIMVCTIKGKKNERSALISHENNHRPTKRYSICKKSGHTISFCWDLHLKKKNMRWKVSKHPSNKWIGAMAVESSEMRAQNKEKNVLQVNKYINFRHT